MKSFFEDFDELVEDGYRFCSKCKRYKPVASIGCWGYRYLCDNCWKILYNEK